VEAGDKRALALLGNTYSEFGEYQKAAEYYEKFLRTNPVAMEYYQYGINLGRCYVALGEEQKALDLFSRIGAFACGRNEHLVFMGEIYYQLSDFFRSIYFLTLATSHTIPDSFMKIYPEFYGTVPWKLLRRAYTKIQWKPGIDHCNQILEYMNEHHKNTGEVAHPSIAGSGIND
jgi:tetratricopeptide (TPR) repeat protein